jgi:hypothetical protein
MLREPAGKNACATNGSAGILPRWFGRHPAASFEFSDRLLGVAATRESAAILSMGIEDEDDDEED